tara:strand:- start:281 stop:511 length:231 start_codon:yes stop_codon:yes gene_type:complete
MEQSAGKVEKGINCFILKNNKCVRISVKKCLVTEIIKLLPGYIWPAVSHKSADNEHPSNIPAYRAGFCRGVLVMND